jgi:hypothetical protein
LLHPETVSTHSPNPYQLYRLTSEFLIEPIRSWLSGGRPAERASRPDIRNRAESADKVGRINVNVATEEERKRLPGIGGAIARRLIDSRPFSILNDLGSVSGIGSRNLKRIEMLIRLD